MADNEWQRDVDARFGAGNVTRHDDGAVEITGVAVNEQTGGLTIAGPSGGGVPVDVTQQLQAAMAEVDSARMVERQPGVFTPATADDDPTTTVSVAEAASAGGIVDVSGGMTVTDSVVNGVSTDLVYEEQPEPGGMGLPADDDDLSPLGALEPLPPEPTGMEEPPLPEPFDSY